MGPISIGALHDNTLSQNGLHALSCLRLFSSSALAWSAVIHLACGRGEPSESTASVDTLPGGITVVSNGDRGEWDSSSAWWVEEELRIGSAEGSGPDVFGRVIGLEVDSEGRIYVLDRQAQEIRIFSPEGNWIRTIGRRGHGPGEFAGANGMRIDPRGRLWVVDPRNVRYHLFDSSGKYVSSYRREGLGFGFAWRGEFDEQGRLLDHASMTVGQSSALAILTYDSVSGYVDTLRLPPFEAESFQLTMTRGSSVSRAFFPIPFTPLMHWAHDPAGGVWFGVSDRYRLIHLDRSGDTTLVIQRAWDPAPVSPEARDQSMESLRNAFSGTGERLDEDRVPDTYPAYLAFVVDDAGYLWVLPTRDHDAPGVILDVFAPDGRYLGEATTPMRTWSRFPLPIIRGDAMYYVTAGDFDVPIVVRARVHNRSFP